MYEFIFIIKSSKVNLSYKTLSLKILVYILSLATQVGSRSLNSIGKVINFCNLIALRDFQV